jgi:type II secretory pathway component PulM
VIETLLERWSQSAAGRWFDTLEARDRAIVVALTAAFAAVVLFLGVAQPLYSWAEREAARYERQVALLDWMRSNGRRRGPWSGCMAAWAVMAARS